MTLDSGFRGFRGFLGGSSVPPRTCARPRVHARDRLEVNPQNPSNPQSAYAQNARPSPDVGRARERPPTHVPRSPIAPAPSASAPSRADRHRAHQVGADEPDAPPPMVQMATARCGLRCEPVGIAKPRTGGAPWEGS